MNKSPHNRASIEPNYSIFNFYALFGSRVKQLGKRKIDEKEQQGRKVRCLTE